MFHSIQDNRYTGASIKFMKATDPMSLKPHRVVSWRHICVMDYRVFETPATAIYYDGIKDLVFGTTPLLSPSLDFSHTTIGHKWFHGVGKVREEIYVALQMKWQHTKVSTVQFAAYEEFLDMLYSDIIMLNQTNLPPLMAVSPAALPSADPEALPVEVECKRTKAQKTKKRDVCPVDEGTGVVGNNRTGQLKQLIPRRTQIKPEYRSDEHNEIEELVLPPQGRTIEKARQVLMIKSLQLFQERPRALKLRHPELLIDIFGLCFAFVSFLRFIFFCPPPSVCTLA